MAERCAFEHEVRRFLTRAQERGYAYPVRFPQMPTLWVDFVNQNKAAETSIARLNVRRSYEAGRREATEATNEGWAPEPKAALPARPEAFDPIAMIDRLVQDAVAQRVAQLVPANVAPLAPSIAPLAVIAPSQPTNSDDPAASSSDRMSSLLQEFLRPASRKRQHTMKGRGEAEAVVQFAIDFLGDPRMNELTDDKWKLLDEIARACKRIRIKRLAPYSTRHVGMATAKIWMSPAEVAASSGHKTTATATKHYARRQTGWRNKRQRVIHPMPEAVAQVSRSLKANRAENIE